MDDSLIFWGLILLIGVILFFGIPFFVFYVLKKTGKPKIGKILGIGIFILFISFFTYVIFEDYFFFKSSARKELKELNIVLNEDFEILNNESGGFTDYYHIFKLKISKSDVYKLTENKDVKNNPITIVKIYIESNIWKEIKINTENKILTYEYIIN